MFIVKILLVILLLISSPFAQLQVENSVHNLSVSGPGQIKSQVENRICIYCHIPHSARPDAPLWNRLSSGGHINYQSSSSDASPGQLSKASVNCLSCHDGTIALGDLSNSRIGTPGATDNLNTVNLTGRSGLGIDLTDDHPISIIYNSGLSGTDPELVNPVNIDLPLPEGELHCNSCHDVHDNFIPPFLHKSTLNGELCVTCHTAAGITWDWLNSSHATSNEIPRGASDPWSERKPEWKGQNVAENACMNCHTPHNATTPQRLVKNLEEHTCYNCHDGSVGANNINAEFQKFFRHPVDITPNVNHDSEKQENPLTMTLHVECQDCHNPHGSFDSPSMISFNPSMPLDTNHSVAPFANGSLAGVKGIDISGNVKQESEFEYEVCFKCHGVPGDSACGNSRCGTADGYRMTRQDGVYNLRDKFDTGNPSLVSYHPVYANNSSNNNEVPSLRNNIQLDTVSSLIYCMDCHNSNDAPAAGGAGPSGPHGSSFEGLMTQRYSFNPITRSPTTNDALCFKCHDANNLFSDVSFEHDKHVLGEGFGCINCHDPHGSSAFPHMINFLTSSNVNGTTRTITGAAGFAQPTWQDDGQFRGSCFLNCHGEEHDGWNY